MIDRIEYLRALGARLRKVRRQQGLSLQGVEEKSAGRWKSAVVGSYERGDRTLTVPRLAELADFYGVPVVELLPDRGGAARGIDSVMRQRLEDVRDGASELLGEAAQRPAPIDEVSEETRSGVEDIVHKLRAAAA